MARAMAYPVAHPMAHHIFQCFSLVCLFFMTRIRSCQGRDDIAKQRKLKKRVSFEWVFGEYFKATDAIAKRKLGSQAWNLDWTHYLRKAGITIVAYVYKEYHVACASCSCFEYKGRSC